MTNTVIVVGFFPPPTTGQALATERLAELLQGAKEVIRVNIREGETELDLRVAGRMFQKISAYWKAGNTLRKTLDAYPEATVIWAAISPEVMGHFRDVLTIVPQFRPGNRIYGVVHWGRFSRLFRSWASSFTAKKLLSRLEGLVFLTRDRADDCKKWVPHEKRFVIHNTLDRAVLCSDEEIERKQAASHDGGPLRLLFLGHMIREKGYLDVLEAVRLLNDRNLPLHATFAGQWMTDADRLAFERRVSDYRLESVVEHLGPIRDRKSIKSLHLDADVFVMPSYMIEGQPLTILEAMNAGCPVITSNVGGMVDMIFHGKEGFLLEPQNPEAIADSISQLVDRKVWLAQSKAARARYLEDYRADAVLEKWLSLLSEKTAL